MMIQSKMKPNGVNRSVAVLLVVICFFHIGYSYVHSSSSRLVRKQHPLVDSNRITKDRQRSATIFRRERVDVDPHIRDVRADSRQSRIDARDIRTDFREIRSELIGGDRTQSKQYRTGSRDRSNDFNNNRVRQTREYQSTNSERNLVRLDRTQQIDAEWRVSDRSDPPLENRRIQNENRDLLDRRVSEDEFLNRVYRLTSSAARDRRSTLADSDRRTLSIGRMTVKGRLRARESVRDRVNDSRRKVMTNVDVNSIDRFRINERLVRVPKNTNDRNRSDERREYGDRNLRRITQNKNIDHRQEQSEIRYNRFNKTSADERIFGKFIVEGDISRSDTRLLTKRVEDVAFMDKYPNIIALNSIKVLFVMIILGQIFVGSSKSNKFRFASWPTFHKIKTA